MHDFCTVSMWLLYLSIWLLNQSKWLLYSIFWTAFMLTLFLEYYPNNFSASNIQYAILYQLFLQIDRLFQNIP